MQGKLLVCSLFVSLIIFNVLAEDVGGDDDDADLEEYQATLVDAADTIIKNLNFRDVRDLERRGWLSKVWNKYIKPAVTTAAGLYLKNVLVGKRAPNVNEAWQAEVRDVKGPDCAKDSDRLKKIKKAAAQLCDLARIPDLQCQ